MVGAVKSAGGLEMEKTFIVWRTRKLHKEGTLIGNLQDEPSLGALMQLEEVQTSMEGRNSEQI